MSRSTALIETAQKTLNNPTPASLYQWVQHLDSEYIRHRYPELLIHYLPELNLNEQQRLALVAAVESLKLATTLQLHTHSRRVYTAAALSRALVDDVDFWQQQGLKQPLWKTAFQAKYKRDSYYFCEWVRAIASAQLSGDQSPVKALITGPQRNRYWLFAQQLQQPATVATGCSLVSSTSERRVQLLTAEPSHWLIFDSDRQKLERIPTADLVYWQPDPQPPSLNTLKQLDYVRALNQNLPALNFKAPKPLLSAIKRYTAGKGALQPVIDHIQQRPLLAESIRQAAAQEPLQANDPWRMDLKHLYLWLGGTKASVILATASLQQQFMQQRVPLQQSLMQRLNLLTELLIRLGKRSGYRLPTPAPLLTLLTAADLFREPRLLRASRWPAIQQISGLNKQAWLGTGVGTDNTSINEQRLARQLITRWQLDKQLAPILQPDQHANDPLLAIMGISNLLVARAFHPDASISMTTKRAFEHAMGRLELSQQAVEQEFRQAIYHCHPFSPLTELHGVH